MSYHRPKQLVKGVIAVSWLLILLAPSQWLPKNRRFLELKILLATSSVIAGWSLIYQHRPERLDDEFSSLERQQQKLEAEFSARQSELDQSVNQTLQEIGEITKQELAQAQEQLNETLAEKQRELDFWKNTAIQAGAPKEPILNSEASYRCLTVQRVLFQKGITLDVISTQPTTLPEVGTPKGERDYYLLHPRGLTDVEKLIQSKKVLIHLLEHSLGESGGIKIEQMGNRVKITFTPGAQTTQTVEAKVLEKKPVN